MEILGECPMTTFSSCNIMLTQRIKGTNLLMISFTSQSTRFTIVPKITRLISKFFTQNLVKTYGGFKKLILRKSH